MKGYYTWDDKNEIENDVFDYPPNLGIECEDEFANKKDILCIGENLQCMNIFLKSYARKIKCIYIDPPYNTGNDFVYNDKFNNDWLSMMYTRLKIAREFLREDGLIFISIDHKEFGKLNLLMSEIFGESNFISNIVWRKRKTQANLNKFISSVHENILVYAKNIKFCKMYKLQYDENYINEHFSNPDNDERGLYTTVPLAKPGGKYSEYEIELPNGRKVVNKWSCSPETFKQYLEDNRIVVPANGNGIPRLKLFLSEKEGKLPNTWLDDHGSYDSSRRDLKKLFNTTVFDYAKPIDLLKHLFKISTSMHDNHIIMDFFAGSGSTGHAIWDLNKEQNSNRKFILFQQKEKTSLNSEAHKKGFNFISDITTKRLELAWKQLFSNSEPFPLLTCHSSYNPKNNPLHLSLLNGNIPI